MYDSEKNGPIQCVGLFGKWHIIAGGLGQTTPYVTAMWKRALRVIPKSAKIKNILVLGLGAGGQIETLHKKFSHPEITALEWDPVMARLAKELRIFTSRHEPRILIGDATELLPKIEKKFDLVLVDLFTGNTPSPSLYSQEFLHEIIKKLHSQGYIIVNVFKRPELFLEFDKVWSRAKTWHYHSNKLALYQHRGKGIQGDPLPEGYVSHKQSLIYLQGEIGKPVNVNKTDNSLALKHVVGEKGKYGLRWNVGPVWVESYETDNEPAITPFHAPRLVIWQPLTRLEKPQGWHRSWIQMNIARTGFSHIENQKQYWEDWSAHAIRHRHKWLRDTRYVIEEVNEKEFSHAYSSIVKKYFLKTAYLETIKRQKSANRDLFHLFAARKLENRQIISGLAVLDLPDLHQSNHVVSFIYPGAKHASVGVGLIDYWFQHAIRNSFSFLNFGAFWAPGDPSSWKGFSRFKSQFGAHLV